jgi:5-methylcytosine-specific restriction endonuclease McrA
VKFCKKCNAETERYVNGRCSHCNKVYLSANYKANKVKCGNSSAAWAKANPERRKASHAAWRLLNKAKCNADSSAYCAANKEKRAATNARWRKKHPEATRVYAQNRSARQRANGGKLSTGLSAKLFKLQRGLCPCCGKTLGADFHLDHIIPIKLGGMNIDSNIQLLRKRCNIQKSAKHPIEFMQSRGFLL